MAVRLTEGDVLGRIYAVEVCVSKSVEIRVFRGHHSRPEATPKHRYLCQIVRVGASVTLVTVFAVLHPPLRHANGPMTLAIGEQFIPGAASLIIRRRGSAAVRSRCNRLRAAGAAEVRRHVRNALPLSLCPLGAQSLGALSPGLLPS